MVKLSVPDGYVVFFTAKIKLILCPLYLLLKQVIVYTVEF